jgi:hypothetical protein
VVVAQGEIKHKAQTVQILFFQQSHLLAAAVVQDKTALMQVMVDLAAAVVLISWLLGTVQQVKVQMVELARVQTTNKAVAVAVLVFLVARLQV